jgi:hypothetical protein
LFFYLYVRLAFLELHKTATGCGCFLGLQRFSAAVSVCNMRFCAHRQHGSMLNSAWCACAGMLSLLFSAQEACFPLQECFSDGPKWAGAVA